MSLAWQAGSPRKLRSHGRRCWPTCAPDQVLRPPKAGFPLSEDEMRWQLAFLGDGDKRNSGRWIPRRL